MYKQRHTSVPRKAPGQLQRYRQLHGVQLKESKHADSGL